MCAQGCTSGAAASPPVTPALPILQRPADGATDRAHACYTKRARVHARLRAHTLSRTPPLSPLRRATDTRGAAEKEVARRHWRLSVRAARVRSADDLLNPPLSPPSPRARRVRRSTGRCCSLRRLVRVSSHASRRRTVTVSKRGCCRDSPAATCTSVDPAFCLSGVPPAKCLGLLLLQLARLPSLYQLHVASVERPLCAANAAKWPLLLRMRPTH
jgi:hypothetical protein